MKHSILEKLTKKERAASDGMVDVQEQKRTRNTDEADIT